MFFSPNIILIVISFQIQRLYVCIFKQEKKKKKCFSLYLFRYSFIFRDAWDASSFEYIVQALVFFFVIGMEAHVQQKANQRGVAILTYLPSLWQNNKDILQISQIMSMRIIFNSQYRFNSFLNTKKFAIFIVSIFGISNMI